jgi:hypothetical protein
MLLGRRRPEETWSGAWRTLYSFLHSLSQSTFEIKSQTCTRLFPRIFNSFNSMIAPRLQLNLTPARSIGLENQGKRAAKFGLLAHFPDVARRSPETQMCRVTGN